MVWLRSLAAILIGGVLSTLLTCAGEATHSSRGNNRTENASAAHFRQLRREGVTDDSIAILASQPGTVVTALEPVPRGAHLIALVCAAMIAGYLAARIAGRAYVLHGALIAWPTLLLTLAFLIADAAQFEWSPIGDVALGALSGAAGGWFHHRQHVGRMASQ
ncbi:MAG: hypothetical protein V4550_00975 [Gemmatimonadota bacterium]